MDDLYKRRTAVEREFGNLKHNLGLAFLRVCGIERVRLHADLVMLGRLSLALARRVAPVIRNEPRTQRCHLRVASLLILGAWPKSGRQHFLCKVGRV